MTYKRFSPDADTFLVIRFKPVFGKTEFFNSYSLYHSLFSHAGIVSDNAINEMVRRSITPRVG
jgi:hypothetical protein